MNVIQSSIFIFLQRPMKQLLSILILQAVVAAVSSPMAEYLDSHGLKPVASQAVADYLVSIIIIITSSRHNNHQLISIVITLSAGL